MTLHTTTLG